MKMKPMRSLAPVLAAAVLAAGIAGCAGRTKYVDIDSKPTGAAIYLNGDRRGTTRDEKVRIDFTGGEGQRVLIQIVKPRYKPAFQYWRYDEVPDKKVFPLEVD